MPGSLTIERVTGEASQDVVVLTLRQADRPVVVLDSALLEAIDAAMDEVDAHIKQGGVGGFVLASDSRVFVAGANLKELELLDDADALTYLRRGTEVYERISGLPVTTVAAIHGAALGGGLEIALHCDQLVCMKPQPKDDGSVREYQVGLPEAGLGLCPGWGGTQTLVSRVDADAVQRVLLAMAEGKSFARNEMEAIGLFDAVAENPDHLREVAVALASAGEPRIERAGSEPRNATEGGSRGSVEQIIDSMGGDWPNTEAAAAVLDCVRIGLRDGYRAALKAEQAHLVRLRHTEQAQQRLAEFFGRS